MFIEIRIHGRGGQGVVTAAELIAQAGASAGQQAQAFPNFGVERRGAPIEAYVRFSDRPIRLRSQIYQPTVIIVQDDSLLSLPTVWQGANKNTVMIINSVLPAKKIKTAKNVKVFTIPATAIAQKNLGKPIINTALLGAFAAYTKLISLPILEKVIKEHFLDKPALINKNIRAAKQAYQYAKTK
jgi:pyruvate ferredoxin oxidoreductase gamma subunit